MISPALKALLDVIRKHEGGTYGRIYYGAKGVPKDTDVSKLTLDGVLALQQRMLKAGSASTACGGYQFLRKTLLATISQMGLTGKELWDADLQDRMALHLMMGRGLAQFVAGRIGRDTFANNLAMEWASLPVVSPIIGARKKKLTPGQSYYAGDGLNKSFHKPEVILALLDDLRQPPRVDPTVPDVVAPENQNVPAPAPVKTKGLLLAFIELIMSIFKRRE